MNDPPLPRYNRTNSVPREVLASVVDDFNSGNPDLVSREWFGAIPHFTQYGHHIVFPTVYFNRDGGVYDYSILLHLYIIL